MRATPDDGEERAQRGQAGGDDAHAGLGEGPDGRVDVVPCHVEVSEASKDDEADDADDADAGGLFISLGESAGGRRGGLTSWRRRRWL